MPRPPQPPAPARAGSTAARALIEAVQRDFQRALGLHKASQLDAAAKLYRSVLQRAPAHADAMQLLGAIEGQQGHTELALTLLQAAVALRPANGHAHNNLGRALALAGRHEDALASFQRAAALMPDSAKALSNCSRTLRALNRLEGAMEVVDRALALDPDSLEALLNRGELQLRLGIDDPARREEAALTYRHALTRTSQPEMIRFVLAALGAAEAPAAPPAEFIAALFDNYADKFDEHLVGTLNYRTPELVVAAVQAARPPAGGLVLDLGCGTGLCGPLLRPLAGRLVGVDLSQRMLDKARERNLYDALVCAELVEHLQAASDRLSIVVAADVFVYIGDLSAVFAAVRRRLQDDGLFVFSVEALHDDGGDFMLRPSRRYQHTESYVLRLAQQHGYAPPLVQPVKLREENQAPVKGLLAVLRPA